MPRKDNSHSSQGFSEMPYFILSYALMSLLDYNYRLRPVRSITIVLIGFITLLNLSCVVTNINYELLKNLDFLLVILITSGLLYDLMVVENRKRITSTYLLLLIATAGIIFGTLSGLIIGFQTQGHHEGAMQGYSIPEWIYTLGLIYPFSFSIFSICMRLLNSWIVQVCMLVAWILLAAGIAYFYPPNYTDESIDFYVGSDTEIIAPIILITVALWTLFVSLVKAKVIKMTFPGKR